MHDFFTTPIRSARFPVAWGLLLALLLLATTPAAAVITITEIMYHPRGGGRSLEYIEILNETPAPMDITGYYFSEGVSFTFTERTFLDPGEYLVVCADKAQIEGTYGITNVAGNWSPDTSLDNGGERVSLSNPGGRIVASVRYNDRGKWPGGADGTGHSLEIRDPYREMDDPDSWALSGVLGGSPGKPNQTDEGSLPVVVNEALCLRSTPGDLWVELYNKGDTPIDLSGFRIATDRLGEVFWAMPADTTIPPRGRISFSEAATGLDFSPQPPTPGGNPGPARSYIALINPDNSRVIDARTFEPQEDLSEARIPDGAAYFSSAADPTRDAANKVTVVEDVVINEIMYHPIDNDPRNEYLELYNRGTKEIDIGGWSFTDGVGFVIPEGTRLAPDAYLVVAPYPEHVRQVYGLAADRVIGPADGDAEAIADFGVLANRGERVTLSDPRGNIADTVRYWDGGEWPAWADAGGSSMELIDPFQDNARAQAWDASDDAAKSPVMEYTYTGRYNGGESEFHLVLPGGGITLVDDLKMTTAETTVEAIDTYVDFDATYRYFKGLSEPSDPMDAWTAPDFDDSAWETGATIIGYGEKDEATLLEDMRGNYISFYLRREFQVDDISNLESLILQVEYDDGYIAYLNGTEIALGNMDPEERTYDAKATRSREKLKETLDLTDRADLLVAGRNVLAVQVHNASITSSDARFMAQLVNGRFVVTEGPNLFKDGTFETSDYSRYWTIQGTHIRSGRTEIDPLSGAGSLKIVCSGGGDNKVNRIETSNLGFPTTLARNTDFKVSFLARWIVGSPTLLTHGAYFSSAPASYASSTRLAIPDRLGTPGEVNSVTLRQAAETGSGNLGPVIDNVSQSNPLPATGEAVTVRARITDPDGVAGATLHYSLETPRAPESTGHEEIPMAGPDPDGYYTAEIPGQSIRRRVVFYLEATDTKGAGGRFPLDTLHRTYPLVLDPANATVNDARYVVYRHDTPYRGSKQSYRFWLHQANEQYMATRRKLSNDYVDGSFLFENRDMYYNSKVRFSGSPWARQVWTESYRIKLPRDNPLHGSIGNFNMEDHQNGGARSGLERISHYLLRYSQGTTRVPYSLQWQVQLQVNNRINEIREHVQTPTREFVSNWYPDDNDGSHFEMDDRFVINDAGERQDSMDGRLLYPPYGSSTAGEDKEQYRYFFNLRLNRHLDNYSELIAFAKLMSPTVTRDDAFDEQIWDACDVEEMLRVWAVRLNTDDWDTWGANRGKNCYLYRPPIDGRWINIAWDMELTYGNVGSFMPPALSATSNPTYSPNGKFPEVVRFLNRPPIKRMYYGIMKEMIDNQFSSSFLAPYMQKLDRAGVLNTNVGKPGGFIDQRRARLAGVVRGVSAARVDFAITTNGGEPILTENPEVTIEGMAPVEVFSIVVLENGSQDTNWAASFSRTSVVRWSAAGTLPQGTTRLDFLAFDGSAQLLGSVSIEVTVGAIPAPAITAVEPASAGPDETVLITGSNFLTGLDVFFGEVQATDVIFDSETDPSHISAVVPQGITPGKVDLVVSNVGGVSSEPFPMEITEAKPKFTRGDSDSNGKLDVADAILTLEYLFLRGAEPSCLDAADANDDDSLNVTDAIVTILHLFEGGPDPAQPFPEPGFDPPTGESLGCASPPPGT